MNYNVWSQTEAPFTFLTHLVVSVCRRLWCIVSSIPNKRYREPHRGIDLTVRGWRFTPPHGGSKPQVVSRDGSRGVAEMFSRCTVTVRGWYSVTSDRVYAALEIRRPLYSTNSDYASRFQTKSSIATAIRMWFSRAVPRVSDVVVRWISTASQSLAYCWISQFSRR